MPLNRLIGAAAAAYDTSSAEQSARALCEVAAEDAPLSSRAQPDPRAVTGLAAAVPEVSGGSLRRIQLSSAKASTAWVLPVTMMTSPRSTTVSAPAWVKACPARLMPTTVTA